MEEKINEILKLTEDINNTLIALYIVIFFILVGSLVVTLIWYNESEKKRIEKEKKKERDQLKRDVKKEIIDYYNETKEFNGGVN